MDVAVIEPVTALCCDANPVVCCRPFQRGVALRFPHPLPKGPARAGVFPRGTRGERSFMASMLAYRVQPAV